MQQSPKSMAHDKRLGGEETKIAVLSVLKKGSILKRIFLSCPPPPPTTMDVGCIAGPINLCRGGEEGEYRPILFGRHPDCHVVLDHPSISRFHLIVRLDPSRQKLSVTDLSSVHGTWVSGAMIPPNAVVDLVDGDSLKLGGSTRVYRLQWVSPSRALEMENPLEPVAEDKEETVQDDCGLLATDVNELWPTMTVENPLGPVVQLKEETNQDDYREFATDVSEMGVYIMENALEHVAEEKEATYQDGYGELATDVNEMFPLVIPSAPPLPGSLNSSPLPLQMEQQSTKTPELESLSFIAAVPTAGSPQALSVVKLQSEQEYLSPDKCEKRSAPSSLLPRRSKSKSIGFLRVDTGTGKEKAGNASSYTETKEGLPKENSNVSEHSKRVENFCRELFGNVDEISQDGELVIPSAPSLPGSLNSSPLLLQMEQQSTKTPELESLSFIAAVPTAGSPQALSVVKLQSEQEYLSPDKCEKRSAPSSLLSRRSKSKSIGFLRVDTGTGKEKAGNASSYTETKEGLPKENSNVSEHSKRVENFCRELFGNVDEIAQDGEECFDSDKENVTQMSGRQKIEQSSKFVQKSFNFRQVDTGRLKQKVDNARSSAESRKRVAKENNNVSEREKKVEKVSMNLFGSVGEKEQEQEEFFDSDKENVTPISSRQKIKRSSSVLHRSVGVAEHANIAVSTTRSANKESKRVTFENLLNTMGERSLITDQKRTKSSSVSARESKMCLKEEEKLHPCNIATSSELEYLLRIDKDNQKMDSGKEMKSCQEEEQKLHSCNVTTSSELEDLLHFDNGNQKMDSYKEIKSEVTSGTLVKVEDDEDAFPSDKENLTPQVSKSVKLKVVLSNSCARIEKEIMQKKANRIPFQPLLQIPPQENDTKEQMKSSKYNCAPVYLDSKSEQYFSSRQANREVLHSAAERKIWNIVVDANCFLDEQSRRSLQLLEGLKGTHLIIPRIVIRELDCLKRRESLFSSRATKMASKALQWIEECMTRASWWIHVQSTCEIMPVAPTPPISPRSLFSDDTLSKSFSLFGSLSEIASPTADDHILDCALLFKKIEDGQFVILSNSTTLKIKAMAEGLSCETPEEFRESLVNPFSKRFLWAKSSPRGLIWSFPNDMGNSLPHQPVRKVGKSAEAVTGLKLILLHNTNYAQINSVN